MNKNDKFNIKIEWDMIFLIILIISVFIYNTIDSYFEHKENIVAIQNGYVQKVVEGKKIWIKKELK